MKQFLLFACLSVFTLGLSAQVFVDADATGAGDGTSWANAYTSLNDAIIAAAPGSTLWVASGTYVTPDTTAFFIDKELSLLGGFAGTETSADAADPAANETILSGDVAGDDVMGTYDSLAREDNNRVLVIDDTSSTSKYVVTIDGFTIANGVVNTRDVDYSDGVRTPFAGGGILSFARLAASRLKFVGNFADYGSNVALISASASGTVLEDMTVAGNYSGFFSQYILIGVNDITIRNSSFDGESTVQESGFIGVLFSEDITVDNCTFSNLDIGSDVGVALGVYESDDVLMKDCTLDGLRGRRGGFYAQQAADFVADEMDENDFVMQGCTVRNGRMTERGGAMVGFNTNVKMVDCVISNIEVNSIGAGIYQFTNDNRNFVTVVDNTSFTNLTDQGAGAGICLLGRAVNSTVGTISNSTFDNCISNGGQGAILYADGTNDFTITNTTIENSVAITGTIMQRGLISSVIRNVTFRNNGNSTAAFQGAGITNYFDEGSAGTVIDSCVFEGNAVTDSGSFTSGGAAYYALGGDVGEVPVTITNTLFSQNAADAGRSGGAIHFIGGFNLQIDNSDFIANSAGGQGGAIQLDVRIASRDTVNDVITTNWQPFTSSISNAQFIDQIAGTQGGAIATARVASDLINCVFINNTLQQEGVSGGALIFNGAAPGFDGDGNLVPLGNLNLDAMFIHNTFVDNVRGQDEAAVGDNIALFQPGNLNGPDSVSMAITMLNNVFFSSTGETSVEVEPGANEPEGFVPVGDLFVTSLGGNFFNSEIGADLTDILLDTDVVDEDVTDLSKLFVDAEDDNDMGRDLSLFIPADLTENPLINGGVTNALVPATGLGGNPRGEAPDVGAFEAEWSLVGTTQPVENSGLALEFFPNPTADVLSIRNTDAEISKFRVLMFDQAGRLMKAAAFTGETSRLDLTNVPSGVYSLQLIVNGNVYSKQIVKQ